MQAAEHSTQLILALQGLEKARSGVEAAKTPFLPSVTASVQGERYVNVNPQSPPAVVGSTVVGAQASKFINYASVSTTLNLYITVAKMSPVIRPHKPPSELRMPTCWIVPPRFWSISFKRM